MSIFIFTTTGCAVLPDLMRTTVDINATFSHDGEKLALISQRDCPECIALYLADKDGTNERLLSRDIYWSIPPVFTLDNLNIIFLSKNKKDIVSINVDTGITKIIYSLSKITHYPIISADGSTIVLKRLMRQTGPTLIVIRTDDKRIIEINESKYPYDFISPNISSDGSKIAFFHDKNLYVMGIKDLDVECMTRKYSSILEKDWPDVDLMMPSPMFSSDSRYIVFSTQSKIYLTDIVSKELNSLVQCPHKLRVFAQMLSPNNKYILFNAEGFQHYDWIEGLYLFNLEKGTTERLTHFSMFFTFSPDGKNILYHSGSERYNHGLYIMDIDGKNVRQISPDCKWCR